MTFKAGIQAFLSPFGEGATDQTVGAMNWSTGKFFNFSLYNSVDSLIRFNYATGVAEAFNPISNLANGGVFIQALGLGQSGNLYAPSSSSNASGLQEVSAETLKFIESWGGESNFQVWANPPTNTVPANVATPLALCGCGIPDYDFIVGTSSVFGSYIESFLGPAWFSTGGIVSPAGGIYQPYQVTPYFNRNAQPVQGIPGKGYCYVIGWPVSPDDDQALTFWKITVSGVVGGFSISQIGYLLPAAVDSTWTQIYLAGAFTDQTDGKLVLKVTTVGATQENYIIKVADSAVGSPLWKVPTGDLDSGTSFSGFTQVRNGLFCHYSALDALYQINTITGSYTTIPYADAFEGVFGLTQCFNDSLGVIILNTEFAYGGASSPTPLNGTPDEFSAWAALYVTQAQSSSGGAITFNRIWGSWNL